MLNGLNLEVMSQQAMRFRSGHCRQADQISHDVRFWHKADIALALPIVRFQSKEDVAIRIERPLANQSTTFKVAQVKVGSTLRLR